MDGTLNSSQNLDLRQKHQDFNEIVISGHLMSRKFQKVSGQYLKYI